MALNDWWEKNESRGVTAAVLFGAAVLIPLLTLLPEPGPASLEKPRLQERFSGGSSYEPTSLQFDYHSVGFVDQVHPLITNVQVTDIDGDGKPEVLVCDAQRLRISYWNPPAAHGVGDDQWTETVIAEDVSVPAHATVVDVDQDGDSDIVLSVLGDLQPSDEPIGRVDWLRNDAGTFTQHILYDDVRRVADVQPGDFDQDGDIDLIVAVFGYARGRILLLENRGEGRFRDHQLHYAPGTIHVPVADFDGDGDLDFAAIVSQDDEELWAFENTGNLKFEPRLLWRTSNFDIGSAGLIADDLDQDGDTDLILPVGDNLEYAWTYPQPYHGCLLFDNTGDWKFDEKRISDFGGTYAAAVGDLDGDSDRDVVLVSMFNEWQREGSASVICLENDGSNSFTPRQIAEQPIHLVTAACGDLNQDGRDDIVAGGLHWFPPYDRMDAVSVWLSRKGDAP